VETIIFDKINRTKLYLGPMSKNIVDAIIRYSEEHNRPIGLIASRRQIDGMDSYVNNWTTETFTKYVRKRSNNIILCRDHGGIGQGSRDDTGVMSLLEDAKYMDIIHIDPWKKLEFKESVDYTIDLIKSCHEVNKTCMFEIGTEESIYPMNADLLETFLRLIRTSLSKYLYSKIKYVVIQSGTSLEAGENTGSYSQEILLDMLDICNRFNIMSKEHNGDYISATVIKKKLDLGLSAINIAPELANIETKHVLENTSTLEQKWWFDLIVEDGQWKKWFPTEFIPQDNKFKVLALCGHYVFSHSLFNTIFDLNKIYYEVRKDVYSFIYDILND
jgi:fructose/tagatose bisphosphate aldolase